MKYDSNNLLKVGTRIIVIKDIDQNNVKVGQTGWIGDTQVFQYTYVVFLDNGIKVPVYSTEIDPLTKFLYEKEMLQDQLSYL